jgi:hypothetical protein
MFVQGNGGSGKKHLFLLKAAYVIPVTVNCSIVLLMMGTADM